MKFRHRWLIEGRVANFALSEPPTNLYDSQTLNAAFTHYLDEGAEQGVHLIVDVREEGDLMPDIKAMLQAPFVRHKKIICLILVCHPYQVQRMIGELLSRKGKIIHTQVYTFEEALARLQAIDTSLPEFSYVTDSTPEFIVDDYPAYG